VDRPGSKDPFADLFGDLADRLGGDRWQPALDVFETEKEVVVRVELAGVHRDRIRVTVHGGQLRIHGERVPPGDRDVLRHHQMEIAFGPFERVLNVGVPFEREGVVAHLEDGFLTVTLPKRGRVRRRIEVESSG